VSVKAPESKFYYLTVVGIVITAAGAVLTLVWPVVGVLLVIVGAVVAVVSARHARDDAGKLTALSESNRHQMTMEGERLTTEIFREYGESVSHTSYDEETRSMTVHFRTEDQAAAAASRIGHAGWVRGITVTVVADPTE
jgi:hypothetical protein